MYDMKKKHMADVTENDIKQSEYLKIFKNAGVDINTLPVLDLGDRMGNTDYIDFIDYKEMKAPIMKFRDCYGRPGIILILTNKVDFTSRYDERKTVKPGEYKGTIALFQRYTDLPTKWSFGFGHSDPTFERQYNELTNSSFEEHAGVVNYKMLEGILNGTDPVIALG
jgi:hypothetical protein